MPILAAGVGGQPRSFDLIIHGPLAAFLDGLDRCRAGRRALAGGRVSSMVRRAVTIAPKDLPNSSRGSPRGCNGGIQDIHLPGRWVQLAAAHGCPSGDGLLRGGRSGEVLGGYRL